MIGRLEESVCGKSDDATLASIYHRVLPTTITWLDRVADAKPKYAALTRLGTYHTLLLYEPSLFDSDACWSENFFYMGERLVAINPSPESPLPQYAAQAQAKYVDNLQRHMDAVWAYEFKQLAVRVLLCVCLCVVWV